MVVELAAVLRLDRLRCFDYTATPAQQSKAGATQAFISLSLKLPFLGKSQQELPRLPNAPRENKARHEHVAGSKTFSKDSH